MAINTSLEATKHRQAKEIRDLRRRLRESRLILPPRAYRAVKSQDKDDISDDEDEDDEEEDGAPPPDSVGDEAYKRIRVMVDGMIEMGKRALETGPEDFELGEKSGVAKVLSAEEVKSWQYAGGEGPPPSPTPSRIAIPDSDDEELQEGNDTLKSEEEVERMAIPTGSNSTSASSSPDPKRSPAPPSPPRITVTP
jgi:hypothetical protein